MVASEDLEIHAREISRTILQTPFTRRTWSELLFLALGTALVAPYVAFLVFTMAVGIAFAITFFGVVIIALCLRGMRVIGGIQRATARGLLGMTIEEPAPFAPRPGFLGWLQSALRDRTGWRTMAYVAVKVPLAFFGTFTVLSIWFAALSRLAFPLSGGLQPQGLGVIRVIVRPGQLPVESTSLLAAGGLGLVHTVVVFFTGVFLFFVAPWVVRVVVYLDRLLMGALLGPDPVTARVRSLEHARAQTVDASAATLRRIERDLHDGTQAQLVALAMRLGMAKEKLDHPEGVDIDQVRDLVNDAHRGAKEAIFELRDIARGIHPPALDIGLEGALSTLAARNTVPTELTVSVNDRPTPAIESIAYFCVAELLANVAQHANASRASVTCAQHGRRIRIVVRDDGIGGAQVSRVGSSSSGLIGLADRVRAVDGRFDIASPTRGPTVVTVDLPLHA